ncbi:MAG: tRNA dihydrouridine synthase DusB [Bacilli bacterium]|nr:tRNA dihydrouridine synthase DusB [Bacilli bacterium]
MVDIKEILKGKVVLAPLAGYTNLAYRKIAKEFGASLVYSEMVSAKGLIYENDKTLEYLNTIPFERPLAIQIFGGDVEEMVKAAKIVLATGNADILDINMGCPVKKVLKQNAGSALLKEPDKVYEMVKRIVEISDIPVSVKIRAGWDHNSINCVEIAKLVEKAGASLITIHGRTKSDLYSGKVNLDYIKAVKEAVKIPVIGNGDIKSVEDAIKMIEYTKVDAIMVGRATLGNPWFIKELVNYFNGVEDYKVVPTRSEKIEMIKRHFEELKKIKDEHIAILEIRSLAVWYVKNLRNVKRFKLALNHVKTSEEFYELLKTIEIEDNNDED